MAGMKLVIPVKNVEGTGTEIKINRADKEK
jgi:hypothetical protein